MTKAQKPPVALGTQPPVTDVVVYTVMLTILAILALGGGGVGLWKLTHPAAYHESARQNVVSFEIYGDSSECYSRASVPGGWVKLQIPSDACGPLLDQQQSASISSGVTSSVTTSECVCGMLPSWSGPTTTYTYELHK
jgi:hypothetical protein